MAPEVLSGNYCQECDIWSFGVSIFMLLTGDHPFKGANRNELFKNIVKGQFEMPEYFSE